MYSQQTPAACAPSHNQLGYCTMQSYIHSVICPRRDALRGLMLQCKHYCIPMSLSPLSLLCAVGEIYDAAPVIHKLYFTETDKKTTWLARKQLIVYHEPNETIEQLDAGFSLCKCSPCAIVHAYPLLCGLRGETPKLRWTSYSRGCLSSADSELDTDSHFQPGNDM